MNRKASKKEMKSQGLSKNAPLWLLFFVACGCMFVLGVLVGRNTMPVRFDMADLNEKLGRLQKSVLTEEVGAGERETPIESIPFEFYEKLRDDSLYVFSDDEDMPLRRIKPKFEKKPSTSATLARVDTEKRERADERPRPSPSQQEMRNDEPYQADRAPVGYVIQVASLRNMESAETVRDRFRSRGYPAYTQQAVVEGTGKWSRVRIGPYKDKEQARDDLIRLQQAGVDAILLLAGDDE